MPLVRDARHERSAGGRLENGIMPFKAVALEQPHLGQCATLPTRIGEQVLSQTIPRSYLCSQYIR
jgi:hypothetical protein